MKKVFQKQTYISLFLFAMLGFTNLISWAQDSVTTTTTTNSNTSSSQSSMVIPTWAWVAGGVVVLILLIALVSKNNNSRTDRVTITKRTDTDV